MKEAAEEAHNTEEANHVEEDDDNDDEDSHDESDSVDSWDEDSDLEEGAEETATEPMYENVQEAKEMMQRRFEDDQDLALFDPVPIVKSKCKDSQEETMATLESLLLVITLTCF